MASRTCSLEKTGVGAILVDLLSVEKMYCSARGPKCYLKGP